MIYLDQTIQDPDGNDISYGIAHFHEKSYAGPSIACSWDYGASAELTYWCNWSDLQAFIETILGRNTVDTVAGNNRYIRSIPHKFPCSQFLNLYASKITSIRGIPGTDATDSTVQLPKVGEGTLIDYRYASVVVQYEPSPWPMLEDAAVPYNKEWLRFTTIQKTPRLDYNVFAVGTFSFVTTPPVAVPHGLPLREQSVDYLVTFHRCPEAFFNPGTFIGKANDADGFLAGHPQVPTAGFLKQTMQFMGMMEIIKPVAFTDSVLYDYQYFFQYRPNGFNKIRRNDSNTTFDYEEFSLDGVVPVDNDTRAVPLDDLTQLFQPNA